VLDGDAGVRLEPDGADPLQARLQAVGEPDREVRGEAGVAEELVELLRRQAVGERSSSDGDDRSRPCPR
jgi:hypothetical protein